MPTNYLCPQKIYKYLTFAGLLGLLKNQTFKLSAPNEFNDPLDMYLQEPIGMELDQFLEGLNKEYLNLVLGDHDLTTLVEGPFKEKTVSIRDGYRVAADDKKEAFVNAVKAFEANKVYKLDHLEAQQRSIVSIIQNQLKRAGVFCCTTDNANLLMWAHYADHHHGAVIEFMPSFRKDSVFLASKPVMYSDVRPLLYRTPKDFIQHSLFMTVEESTKVHIDRLVYTKSRDWQYEKEYRLYVPFEIKKDERFSFIKYHAEELTAIYFGCRMSEDEKKATANLAKVINPHVNLFEVRVKSREFGLTFKPVP